MSNREKIAELVAYDVPKEKIAAALAITPERLMKMLDDDDEIKSLIQKKSSQIALKELDKKITESDVEQSILNRMHFIADNADSLGELASSLYRLRQSKIATGANTHKAETHINLQLGLIAQTVMRDIPIQRNDRSEIIQIDGREMATLPSDRVVEMVKERKNGQRSGEEIPKSIEEVYAEDF